MSSPDNPPTRDSTAGERPTVLIAEDEEPIAEALAMIVEEAGYAPLIAAHGEDALALARTHHPALIITDLMMPYLDGARLIQTLEEDARRDGHQRAPIIVMTAAGGRRLEHLTADALLRKPFEVEDVEELLQRFLEQESKAPSTDEERQA